MSRIIRIFFVDAFTDTAGRGNPAAVALDADQLTEVQMQDIAREQHIGDWAFVLSPSSSEVDLDVRFFSPRRELPFVGHATLALHAVLARIDPRPVRRQQGQSGVVEVRTLPEPASFAIRQPAPALGRLPAATELGDVLALLDLTSADLDPRCPPRIAGGASTRLLLGLRDGAALDRVRPQLSGLAAMSARLGAQGYFLFVLRNHLGSPGTESRMFCPAIGIDEDPVSGNAHAMLGVYLHELGLLPTRSRAAQFVGQQGRHLGRDGEVQVVLELDAAGRAVNVEIAGKAVIVSASQLTLA
ncbi:MAG: PhzF family phenazine biosynthesis isomerase [Steroidobacteraceae bacterium]